MSQPIPPIENHVMRAAENMALYADALTAAGNIDDAAEVLRWRQTLSLLWKRLNPPAPQPPPAEPPAGDPTP